MAATEWDLVIDFWDVGQADCTVLALADGRLILIDVGRKGSPVVDWLAERRPAPSFAAIILTHNDADHAGALPTILNNHAGRVERIWMLRDRPSREEPFAKIFRSVKEAESRGELEAMRLEVGAEIWHDQLSQLRLRVVYPTFVANESATNPNKTSGLIILEGASGLLCAWPGDLPVNVVASRLNDQHPVLLHGPHHGGPTDFKKGPERQLFREAIPRISPSLAFISVGTNNSYCHPRPGYLDLLSRNGCRVFCSEITNACDREHILSGVPVFDGSAALGLRSARRGTPCRGSWRVRVKDGELLPDEFSGAHLAAISVLKRPQCLKGTGWKTGDPLPW